jgi:hypothetical protein
VPIPFIVDLAYKIPAANASIQPRACADDLAMTFKPRFLSSPFARVSFVPLQFPPWLD